MGYLSTILDITGVWCSGMKSSSYAPAQRKAVDAKRGDHCLQADFPVLIARCPSGLLPVGRPSIKKDRMGPRNHRHGGPG